MGHVHLRLQMPTECFSGLYEEVTVLFMSLPLFLWQEGQKAKAWPSFTLFTAGIHVYVCLWGWELPLHRADRQRSF